MGYWSLLFFLSHILFLNSVRFTNAQPDFQGYVCGLNVTTAEMFEANKNTTHTTPTYESNKNTLLSSLSNIGRYGFYQASFGENSDRVNAIALCRGDVEWDICRSCVDDAAHKLPQVCGNYSQAIGWYDYCMTRFSNETIFHTVHTDQAVYTWNQNNVSDSDVVEFNQDLRTLLDRLKGQAASGDSLLKVATGNINGPGFDTIYALSQCTPDLSQDDCINCLNEAARQHQVCCTRRLGARILTPSCNFRFENVRFYNDTPTRGGKDNNTARTIYAIVISTVISVILVVFICIFLRKRKQRKQRKPEHKVEDDDEITILETLRYDFGTIETATNNFSDKLGEGGFGPVYKGTLPNGKEIAVKRLSKGSGQGEQEFRNEVLLVVKLQHRNLVKLVGFCLEGTERLLVYEFLPNKSLDHFIFDPIKRSHLDWDTRYTIIGGIAKGLLYLHEGSQHQIIHRDLKASNILLDADMNPKISDFGMAKLSVHDETHGNTNRIAGTL
ncbi:unnamed protein product [Ilex paraguariensis]|uniref:Uncharacterized protein n=1 Tax=Ilex paraguariensis TaxID=185542 RepID=A0ABC8TIK2_9AQUA